MASAGATFSSFSSPFFFFQYHQYYFLPILLPLLLLIAFVQIFKCNIVAAAASSQNAPSSASFNSPMAICAQRCHRLLRRSLDRIDEHLDVNEVLYRIGAHRRVQLLSGRAIGSSEELALPAGEFRDICWKFFDFEDCNKQCQKLYGKRRKRKRHTAEEEQEERWRRQKRRKSKQQGKQQQQQADTGGGGGLLPEHKVVLHFCRRADLGIPLEQFACVHKYHTFMEVHCSAYQQRMVELRLIGMQLEQTAADGGIFDADKHFAHDKKALGRLRKAVEQELCLRLHQLSACLINAGQRHCPPLPQRNSPTSQHIFTRSTLREHFLSLLLPFGRVIDQRADGRDGEAGKEKQEEDEGMPPPLPPLELDQLFSDSLLDRCQLFGDFITQRRMTAANEEFGNGKKRKKGKATKKKENGEEFDLFTMDSGLLQQQQQRSTTTKRAIFADDAVTVPSSSSSGARRVFSSEEELADVPPNFFYSTARLPKDFYTRYAIWWGGRKAATRKNGNQRHSSAIDDNDGDGSLEFTSVQLLPTDSPGVAAYTELTDQQRQRTTTTTAKIVAETHPDSMPLVTAARGRAANNADGWSVTLPYLVNGRVTLPIEQWPHERGKSNGTTTTTTEIRLMEEEAQTVGTQQQNYLVTTTRGGGKQQTETAMEAPPAASNAKNEEERRRTTSIEEYEEEWAYEDDDGFATSAEFENPAERQRTFTTANSIEVSTASSSGDASAVSSLLKPVDTGLFASSSSSSSASRTPFVEELIREIEPTTTTAITRTAIRHRDQSSLRTPIDTAEEEDVETSTEMNNGNIKNSQPMYTTAAEAEPLFRETNIYFAKILDFSQEPPDDAEWLHQQKEATMAPAQKTVAHIVHFPTDQLPIVRVDDGQSKHAELDGTRNRWPGHRSSSSDMNVAQIPPPFTIMPADSNQFLQRGMSDEEDGMRRIGSPESTSQQPMDVRIAWKTGAPSHHHHTWRQPSTPITTRRPPKIVVSAEPVPSKKSETLLVLLGVYLTFFAVAAFLLFCLVLACLERHRRNTARSRNGTKAAAGSAILYLDAKKGTVKEMI